MVVVAGAVELLQLHGEHGEFYRSAGSYTGFNDAIYNKSIRFHAAVDHAGGELHAVSLEYIVSGHRPVNANELIF